ncbi:cysteine ABC transporter ATP-binding protein/permease [Mycobacterium bohemicum DSM 44277]|uniref:ABC transporter ATP-binding protein n=2 Tax=Mycobacterium bohemicum TaxID=56425 RepID=A0A1X1RDY8_MYCBE|nr:thiol reductant ABC exporter subunit CydD [Mycobacterium bohemicum]MCV6969246.1 thiol reductant ABC exporter subunit CydD [Mycobacterium bohemicum]ORV03701.1 ABC transporter ATP-binding protein [Mycobacterium bohemicum]CPR07894.1 cysteine ABC transporter ATP-binding protein/permease [Mycobacterium bohemicum DSM 44277]
MRRYLLASVGCGVVISGCTIGSAIVLARIVAHVVADPAAAGRHVWPAPLSILLALWLVRTLTHWLQARLGQRGASAVIADLAGQVLTAVTARQPREQAAQRDAAAVLVTRGLDGLRPYFAGYLPTLLLAAILTPATVAVIAVYDLKSTLIVLITLPLIPVFMVLIGLATAERSATALTAMTTLQARLLDLIAGIPTLRALGRTRGPELRIAELAAAHRRSAMATLRIAFLSALVLELLATLGVALIAVSIGLRLVFGEMTLATGLTVLLLAPDVYWPLRRIGVEFHAAQDGRTAADSAFALIGPAPAAEPPRRTVAARGAQIRLERLSVSGRDGHAPRHLSAVIEPGSVTVLTGPNGAGKSTTLQVIAGVTTPSSGRVSVAGVDVTELDPNAWWSQLAWLPQRPALVAGTVGDNLRLFGNLADVETACRAAGFDAVLAELPDGMDTTLGRDGVGLSLGQRQRLGLTRVLGSTAAVLLLDEPTAHLDARTEERVLRAIVERARAGATVVVVGHREPLVAIGDRVVEVAAAGVRYASA